MAHRPDDDGSVREIVERSMPTTISCDPGAELLDLVFAADHIWPALDKLDDENRQG